MAISGSVTTTADRTAGSIVVEMEGSTCSAGSVEVTGTSDSFTTSTSRSASSVVAITGSAETIVGKAAGSVMLLVTGSKITSSVMYGLNVDSRWTGIITTSSRVSVTETSGSTSCMSTGSALAIPLLSMMTGVDSASSDSTIDDDASRSIATSVEATSVSSIFPR